ncbi:MAG: ABC transporter permease [Phycisphaerales bacterium]|nr:ABC transporter permease [Phycisphaerales bacterium]
MMAMAGPAVNRRRGFSSSWAGMIGLAVLALLVLGCLGSLPWTLGSASKEAPARYEDGTLSAILLPPTWTGFTDGAADMALALRDRRDDPNWTPAPDGPNPDTATSTLVRYAQVTLERAEAKRHDDAAPLTKQDLQRAEPTYPFGTDNLGRDVFVRSLTGGGVSIGIGLSAALISVTIGTLYGALAGYVGGRADALMMRIVDILYGLPYILLVVLLAVAGDAIVDEFDTKANARRHYIEQQAMVELQHRVEAGTAKIANKEAMRVLLEEEPELRATYQDQADAIKRLEPYHMAPWARTLFDVIVLLVAIGGVSWLTMARVIRGQVLSLKAQPFMEAARAAGVPVWRQFARHLLPNLLGPIIVYATLTVPQAILQESFLSFLGIGVQPPLPSWGNLAAAGLGELNTASSRWWLLVFPCALLGLTLLALNFVGEGLREAFDPKRSRS